MRINASVHFNCDTITIDNFQSIILIANGCEYSNKNELRENENSCQILKFSLHIATACHKNLQLKVAFALKNIKSYCFPRDLHANTEFAVINTVCKDSHLNFTKNNNNSQLYAEIRTQK